MVSPSSIALFSPDRNLPDERALSFNTPGSDPLREVFLQLGLLPDSNDSTQFSRMDESHLFSMLKAPPNISINRDLTRASSSDIYRFSSSIIDAIRSSWSIQARCRSRLGKLMVIRHRASNLRLLRTVPIDWKAIWSRPGLLLKKPKAYSGSKRDLSVSKTI